MDLKKSLSDLVEDPKSLAAVAAAMWALWQTIRVERVKTALAVQSKGFETLLAKRMAVYPQLFGLLSELAKTEDDVDPPTPKLKEELATVNKWDSANGVFLSPTTSNRCHYFRVALDDAVATVINKRKEKPTSQDTDRHLIPRDQWQCLLDRASDLEVALQSDLALHGARVTWLGNLVLRTRRRR